MASKKEKEFLKQWSPTKKEELLLHNLQTKKYWFEKNKDTEEVASNKKKTIKPIPEKWEMLKGIQLYDWQKKAVESWFKEKRGTIKVVTGAGKTILALSIIEKLQNQFKDLRVAIVVPTIVLLNQWYEEILEKSNLPEEAIGFLGAGFDDSFQEKKKRILLCVLNTASKKLPKMVNKEVEEQLLLVVDECHRAGAPEMRRLFRVKRKYALGLSATPERNDFEEEFEEEDTEETDQFQAESKNNYENSLLGKEIGPIIYEMPLKQAYEMGILPGFEIRHYGLTLTPKEKLKYDRISNSIQDLHSKLKEIGKGKRVDVENHLWSWCQKLSKEDSNLGKLAFSFIWKTRERKSLLYQAKDRKEAVLSILKEEFQYNSDARAILFHEKINEVMDLYNQLTKKKIPVVAENSQLPDDIRSRSIELFRKGIAKVIVSAKSLIEGFNVPVADVGIIVASNTSVRQRIQTIGRLLRKAKVRGMEKKAIFYVLYITGTTDEYIYEKTDWNEIIGAKHNRYFEWNLKNGAKEVDGPPRTPKLHEDSIYETSLQEGSLYPGEYEGIEYSCDSSGNIFDSNENAAINPQDIPDKIFKIRGEYGRFKITPLKKYVLVLKKESNHWKTYYVTTLSEKFKFKRESKESSFDEKSAKSGSEFPDSLTNTSMEEMIFKKKGGRDIIAKKHPGGRGEIYARVGEKAEDKIKGDDALKIIETLKKMQNIKVNKFLITNEKHVIYLEKGKYYYITSIEKELEFPES